MPYSYGSSLYSDSICVYAGQTATDSVGCINREDEFEAYDMLWIDAQMLPTQQIFIEFNGSEYGILRELQVDYYYTGE